MSTGNIEEVFAFGYREGKGNEAIYKLNSDNKKYSWDIFAQKIGEIHLTQFYIQQNNHFYLFVKN
jgi:hypothetical protein